MARNATWRCKRGPLLALALTLLCAGADEPRKHPVGLAGPSHRPAPIDAQTFRATVLIRKGTGQGSGSIIASIPGETLILTVAHVVHEPGELLVELHRFNLGVEKLPLDDAWPRRYPAEVLLADTPTDVALIRIRGLVPLPFVARLADADKPGPERGTVVTSVGIDRDTSLSSWGAHVEGLARLDPHKRGTVRPFLITDHAPDHGRSGGGLFLSDGRLVGVCVGRIDLPKGPAHGVFAPMASIHQAIERAQAAPVIARSASQHTGRSRRAGPPPVTETTNRASNGSR